ncbi:hypothetical protein [Sphingobacterium sp. MYb382]|uniref:hypothetical protein n=1 Tax=Sphingobacterium sp. MYb382 TaxID=2745278 RepID=UPI0030B22256
MVSTVIVKYKLTSAASFESTSWYKKLKEATEQEDGFIDMLQLPPLAEEENMTIVLCFRTFDDATKWMHSATRIRLLEEDAKDYITNRIEQVNRNLFWFSPMPEKSKCRAKQVLVSFIAVYPLTVIVPQLVSALFVGLDFSSSLVKGIVVALIISSLMVYLVMPTVLRVFKKWIG